jgi:hypothetical protein
VSKGERVTFYDFFDQATCYLRVSSGTCISDKGIFKTSLAADVMSLMH